MEIKKVEKGSDTLLESIRGLITQLTAKNVTLSETILEEIITSESTTLFIAKENEHIVGCLALVAYRIPTGLKFWIEDVVVDQNHRGKGIGKRLTARAIEWAGHLGASQINLTSNPKRKAAHALYNNMGFRQRKTTVFRYEINEN